MKAYIRVICNGVKIRSYGGNRRDIIEDFNNLQFLNNTESKYESSLESQDEIELYLFYKNNNKTKTLKQTKVVRNLKVLNPDFKGEVLDD